MSTLIRVIIADDHPLVREGFKSLLRTFPLCEFVAEAANGRELLQQAAKLHPDVVITDLSMPLMDGIEACRKLRREQPDCGVIINTMHGGVQYISDAFEAGARGYLMKHADASEFGEAIQSVYNGDMYYCRETKKQLSTLLKHRLEKKSTNPPTLLFNERELTIMRAICEEKQNKEIAESLNLSVRTVENLWGVFLKMAMTN